VRVLIRASTHFCESIDYTIDLSGRLTRARGSEVTREGGCRIELASDATCVVDEGVFGKMTRFFHLLSYFRFERNEN